MSAPVTLGTAVTFPRPDGRIVPGVIVGMERGGIVHVRHVRVTLFKAYAVVTKSTLNDIEVTR